MPRRPTVSTAVLAMLVALSACARGTTPAEFKRTAEEQLRAEAAAGGVTPDNVVCQQPGNTKVGTVFTCLVVGAGGEEFAFDVLIDEPDHLTITAKG